MKIETLSELNSILDGCGCCTMPICEYPPTAQIEAYTIYLCGVSPNMTRVTPSSTSEALEEDIILYSHYTWSLSSGPTDTTLQDGSASENGTYTPEPKVQEFCGARRVDASFSYTNTVYYDSSKTQAQTLEEASYSINTISVPGTLSGTISLIEYDTSGNITSDTTDPSSFAYSGPQTEGTITDPAWTIGVSTATLTYNDDGIILSDWEGNATFTFVDVYTQFSATAELFDAEIADPFWLPAFSSSIANVTLIKASDNTRIISANATRGKYRWKIPSSHTGSYFRVDWDEVFYPVGWDSEEIGAPVPIVTPRSVEWTGPGNTADTNDASWFTVWSNVVKVPNNLEGTIFLRNVLYKCYRSTQFGSAPTLAISFGVYVPE